jgi:galactokinase
LNELFDLGLSKHEIITLSRDAEHNYVGTKCGIMGGGFGGCTINLVHEDVADSFIRMVSEAYEKEFNIKLTSFEGHPSTGTALV